MEGNMQEAEGVRINLISSRKLDSMSSDQKLAFILGEVRKGVVLVLERGLTAVEEINLIKSTMSAIDQDTFIGIEMQSYSSDDIRRGSWLDKLLRRVKLPRMTVIGPADMLQTIHKDGSMVQAMILTSKRIISESSEDQAPLAKPVGEEQEPGSQSEDTESEDLEIEDSENDKLNDENEDMHPLEESEPADDLDDGFSEDDRDDQDSPGFIYKKVKDEE
jgi:hypothetical protein